MKTFTETVNIIDNHDNIAITRFIAVMGNEIKITNTVWGEDDIEKDYKFTKKTGMTVACGGDDAIGAIRGAFYDEDERLIGIFDFGDDGTLDMPITAESGLMILGDLC